jgi:hypothetical protein
VPLRPVATYKVPFDKRAQLIYLRAGNSTPDMIYVSLNRGGHPIRYFPVGAKGAIHVPLSIVEDMDPESELELCVGASEGVDGAVLIDMGVLEI